MTVKSNKSPEMIGFIDGLTKDLEMEQTYSDALSSETCVMCGGPANEFRDALSKKEFSISGMCQKCQDDIFGE